uniref:Uncharacterized protein n=1 Tax=Cannabis sativa TaxID=3483 RepID=A0A803QWQ4_CANSA
MKATSANARVMIMDFSKVISRGYWFYLYKARTSIWMLSRKCSRLIYRLKILIGSRPEFLVLLCRFLLMLPLTFVDTSIVMV